MTLVTSGPSGGYWTTTGTLTASTGTADVTVDDTITMQTWEGFGGSFNEKGWQYLSSLSEADRNKALQLLFGADGAKFAFGRIPIGSSDYAMNRYTLDEVAGQTDPNLASFSITRDTNQLIPYIKAAQAVKGNIRFWASPWTPPTWMKSSPYQSGNVVSPFDGGTMKSDAATLTAYAQYLIRWVQAYKDMGINVEAVAPQNEPNFGQNYPSAIWATSTYVDLRRPVPRAGDRGQQQPHPQGHARHDVQRRQRQGPGDPDRRDERRHRQAVREGHRDAVGHDEQPLHRAVVQPAAVADRAQVRQLSLGRRLRLVSGAQQPGLRRRDLESDP